MSEPTSINQRTILSLPDATTEKKPPVDPNGIQRRLLNVFLKKHVSVYLTNGIRLHGVLKGYDQYAIDLDGQLVFKHAITSIGLSSASRKELNHGRKNPAVCTEDTLPDN